jgi:hypothetical protein
LQLLSSYTKRHNAPQYSTNLLDRTYSHIANLTTQGRIWEIAHRLIGLIVLIIAVVNVFFGFDVPKDCGVVENFKLFGMFTALVATISALAVVGKVVAMAGSLQKQRQTKLSLIAK